jgi:hypothetical protein
MKDFLYLLLLAFIIAVSILSLNGCTYGRPIEPYPTWKCHEAVAWEHYQRHACVTYTI